MTVPFDIAIIGAGPAGMAAAHEANSLGLSAVVIDEQNAPGGQIYRNVQRVIAERPEDIRVLGTEYAYGNGLADGMQSSGIKHLTGHMVWQIERDGAVWCSDGNKAKRIQARTVVLATGAMERPMPVPGWTLPGVMTAGAAQILMKSAAMIPDGPVVLAGSGPLLLLVADQLIQSGARLAAIAETTSFSHYLAALPKLPKALSAMEYLKKGLQMRRRIKASGVPIISGISGLRINGGAKATGITFKAGGRTHTIAAETVLLHQGVVPNTQASRQLRLDHGWHDTQHYWYPKTDVFGATSEEKVFIAGDGAGIFGARAAEVSGRLSVLQIASHLGVIDVAERDRKAKPLFSEKHHHDAIRPLLDALFPPPAEILNPRDDATIICRCEEVTAGDIRKAASLGAPGPNQLKAFLRAGMGPCQGRMCGLAVTEILAAALGKSPVDIGAYRIRPPLKPLSLAELADMDTDPGTVTSSSL